MKRNGDFDDDRVHSSGLEKVATGDLPDFRAARHHVLVELLRFVATLREEGVTVPATGPLDAARALASVGLTDESRAEAALRASLLSEIEHAELFEEAFPSFWHRLRTGIDRIAAADSGSSRRGSDGDGEGTASDEENDSRDRDALETLTDAEPPDLAEGDGDATVRIPTDRRHATGERAVESTESDARRYSATAGSEPVDAAHPALSSDEIATIDTFVDALATLPGRRRHRSSTGRSIDARSALRASVRTGGAPIELPRTEPTPSELRCRLLVDVSGSVLDTLDRDALLVLAERLVRNARDARVFLFDTDLVEATEPFARADGDPAERLRAAELEWGGGTRIGHAFDALRRTDPHAVDRRTVIVVVSDGLDVGDDELLTDGITWLAGRANAVVWLNPLAVSPAFEPTSRGMSTVLPYLDGLFGFAEASDLGGAARRLERRGLEGEVDATRAIPTNGRTGGGS